jgi:hypothetical protein
MQDRCDTFQVGCDFRRIGEIEGARFAAEIAGQRANGLKMASSQDGIEVAIPGEARSEPAGVAVRAVDHPLPAQIISPGVAGRYGAKAWFF